MANLLIVYASKKGQTRKIAEFIRTEIGKHGHRADLYDVRWPPSEDILEKYDGAVIGAPVYAGHFPKKILQWVKGHASFLSRHPSAFFSVCLGIMQKDDKIQEEERRIATDFFKKGGWVPKKWAIFAGANPYTKYNFLTRWMMRRMAQKAGSADTDTRRDYEYTNWEEIRPFVQSFLSEIEAGVRQESGEKRKVPLQLVVAQAP